MVQKYKDFWELIVALAKKKDVFFNASAITFNLFICSIPFTLLLISIIGYVLSFEAAFQEIVRYGRELFPTFTYESRSGDIFHGVVTIETLLTPLVSARRVVGILGLVILVIFSQGLFHTVKHVVFDIFDIEDRKHPAIEMVYNFFTFGLVGGVFIFFSLAISMVSLISVKQIPVPFTDYNIEVSLIYELLNIIIPVLFTLLLFYILFRYISEKWMSRRVALFGAVFYTLLFEIAKFGIGIYLDYAFNAYRYYYQGYAILVIIGVWAFYSAVLLVLTIIISKAYQDVFVYGPAAGKKPEQSAGTANS